MAIKYTMQGVLIYQAMIFYMLSLLMLGLKSRRSAWLLYGLGFIAAGAALVYRGLAVCHFPLQSLFEVFLFLGAAVFPITWLCQRLFRIKAMATDLALGLVLLFPAGFVFSDQPQWLPPVLQSILFVPHVLVYMLAYVILTKAAFLAVGSFIGRRQNETQAYQLACLGFPLLTLGLMLGSIWGKLAWGDYWNWDPKEMWSLATWLVYVGYFHARMYYANRFRLTAGWLITGFLFIVITLVWVNLSHLFAGMHTYS